MPAKLPPGIIVAFLAQYNATAKDALWQKQSAVFNKFWTQRVMAPGSDALSDEDCDVIIRILDRHGKGNTMESEAVARAMVAQGAWRRMFNDFRQDKTLAGLLNQILEESAPPKKAELIDQLYECNKDRKNNLTGPSGSAIGAFLAAHDPFNNLSIISLRHRKLLIDFLGLKLPFDWDKTKIGRIIVDSNTILFTGLKDCGLPNSARTASSFCYYPAMTALWNGEHTIITGGQEVSVTVPTDHEEKDQANSGVTEVRESLLIQACLAEIGAIMGYKIWLPKSDQARVLKVWKPKDKADLLEELPLINENTILKTIEQIDVIWLKGLSIVRAFEVEHTTSVYSGLLRMADLLALQPNFNIKLHIVAPEVRRDKVFQEIRRPVFQLMEGGSLSGKCTYLSYEKVRNLGKEKFLKSLRVSVLDDLEEKAEES
jgi:hypothetical protein